MDRTNPPLIDLHEDIGYYIYLGGKHDMEVRREDRHGDIPGYLDANMKIVVGAIFALQRGYTPMGGEVMRRYGEGAGDIYIRPSMPMAAALDVISIYKWLVRRYEEFRLVTGRSDIDGKGIGILMGLEGTEYLDDPGDIYLYKDLGIRLIGLTWNYDTKYAASCMSSKDYGLTGSGEVLLSLAEDEGIVIDLAHSSRKTMLEVLETHSDPVLISHSNYAGLVKHQRNVDDEVLDRLASNGGVIGFTYIRQTIGENPGADALARHIDAVAQRFGDDIVAIGTDLFGCNPPEDLRRIEMITNLYNALEGLGWTRSRIEKLAYKNAERVLRRVLE